MALVTNSTFDRIVSLATALRELANENDVTTDDDVYTAAALIRLEGIDRSLERIADSLEALVESKP